MMAAIDKEELVGLVDEIFGAMAGVPLTYSSSSIAPDHQTGSVVSVVQIVGDWQGAVRLDMDMALARLACRNLLGVDADDLSPEDIRDAAGELANMTGGSIKALRAPTAGLSLPSVAIGRHFEFSLSKGKLIQSSSFIHECGALIISIIERQEFIRVHY